MNCEELEPTAMKKNAMLRDKIPFRQRVAVCIWWLTTGKPLRMASKRFGLGIPIAITLYWRPTSPLKTS
ncbi:hypothetical protein GQ457_01G011150 [Hibiscus cannabinus]